MQSCWRDSSESMPECKRRGPNLLMNLTGRFAARRLSANGTPRDSVPLEEARCRTCARSRMLRQLVFGLSVSAFPPTRGKADFSPPRSSPVRSASRLAYA